ncbi:MAG: hydantoin utilization protein B [Acidimicrobiales bacterium mtb01]|nr:hydantoinase B/oxoprolinase family protein [Actinomycetota bacterium]TEX45052.1 MAG: hydantoin utilization protein B [Acidimicrobiales bacterium mtb01]
MSLDPVRLAVINGRLEQIADEMDATLFRSAFNPIIAEAHDASHGIYHAHTGATLVQGSNGLPVFVGSMAGAVRLAIATMSSDSERRGGRADVDGAVDSGAVRDGDVYCFNDPYEGGTHLNDLKMVRPFFRDGRIWCHLASVGHFTDVGGNVPGNYNPAARDIQQEGTLIPPMLIRRAGETDERVVDLVCSISRQPVNAYGDMQAQLNALDLGARRLGELLDEYGDEVVRDALDELTRRAATLMRSSIAKLPDGVYRAVDYLDNDGSSPDLVEVVLTMTVAGDRLHLDFTGTSGAVTGPINISHSTAVAACYVGLKHVFRDVPANFGCLEPVDIVIPTGSLLAATRPRPVGGYTETILRVMDLIFRCVAEADPSASNGCSYGTINALSLAGQRADGSPWVMFTFYGGGLGGSPIADGLNHGNAPLSTATIPPVEILESQYPVRFRRWALRPDSGGEGKFRGGLGASYDIELLADAAEAFTFGDRAWRPPLGVAGGGAAATNEVSFVVADDVIEPELGAKVLGVRMTKGDRVRIESPGGGGYGSSSERDPAAVERDRRLGYVTRGDS